MPAAGTTEKGKGKSANAKLTRKRNIDNLMMEAMDEQNEGTATEKKKKAEGTGETQGQLRHSKIDRAYSL